jgi:hypothetical protein
MSRAVQAQQQTPANTVLEHAVGLPPVPGLAHSLRKDAPVHGRILSNQFAHEFHIGVGDTPPAVGKQNVHRR